MNYTETIQYLFNALPVFQNIGASAYKPGLERVEKLLSLCGNPHQEGSYIHVAGTNGKGSTSHMIASILQASGYRVGLFTSPHLVDFRERIRINGEMISEEYVVSFVEQLRNQLPADLTPSFFEYTTAMALSYFKDEQVDIAVIEVGMGGRLDSTNVITPITSIITNVSIDHASFLGDTLEKIAYEKAGIIKENRPTILGRSIEKEVLQVIKERATRFASQLTLADQSGEITAYDQMEDGSYQLHTKNYGTVTQPMQGLYQIENTNTVLSTCRLLQAKGWNLTTETISRGILNTHKTGLRGRLEIIQEKDPTIIIDTGHNPGAWAYLSEQLQNWTKEGLLCIIGVAGDKEVNRIIHDLPLNARYVFSQASTLRAMPANQLTHIAAQRGLNAVTIPNIIEAFKYGKAQCLEHGYKYLFIGGSNFVVGELLSQADLS